MAGVDKAEYIIVDLGLQSEAAERWPITLLLIQLSGNGPRSFFIWLSHCVKPGLTFAVAAESRETAAEHHGGAAPRWCSVTGGCRCVCVWCIGDRGITHTCVEFALWWTMWNAWMCMFTCVCAGVFGGLIHGEGFPVAVVFSLTAQWHIVTYCSRQCKQQWPLMLLLSSLHVCSHVYMYVCVGMLLYVRMYMHHVFVQSALQ